jgi:hypothetical protein
LGEAYNSDRAGGVIQIEDAFPDDWFMLRLMESSRRPFNTPEIMTQIIQTFWLRRRM